MSDKLRRMAAGLPPQNSTDGNPMIPPGKRSKDYTPHDWNEYWDEKLLLENDGEKFVYYSMGDKNSGCILFLIHGGGFSGLSFSLFGKEITSMINCRLIAPDIRGHGSTECQNENDYSVNRLTNDLKSICDFVIQDKTCVIIGHSMGGSLAVHLSHVIPACGLIVIDAVEGTALDALPNMKVVIKNRPTGFKNKTHAIEWAVRTRYIKNLPSAKISMADQVVEEIIDGKLICKWRTDLQSTETYWREWFTGLSELFLSSPTSKMLLLAGMDRLDTPLTVGQMQGKFQLSVLPQAGHAVHEDQPLQVAQTIAAFVVRHKLAEPKQNYKPVSMVPGRGGLGRMM